MTSAQVGVLQGMSTLEDDMSYTQRGLPPVDEKLLADAAFLKDHKSVLSAKDQAFATSLLDQLDERGLSGKQAYWVHTLADRARTNKLPDRRLTVDLTKINTMFDRAEGMLKRPYVLLLAEGDLELRISPAGPNSRYSGKLIVTTTGPYAARAWLGYIDQQGTFFPSLFPVAGIDNDVVEIALTELAQDPEAKAKAYGQRVGACCFCSRELTDERSVSVGYGPVCAERYGLAWGTCQEVGA